MGFVLLLARIILALVFGLAGATKFLDLKRSRVAMIEFGVPRQLAAPLGFSLPFFELLIACSMLATKTVRWGALAAIILLVIFVLGIVINLSRGKRPDCHCFGQLHSEPVGPSTLLRNGLLLFLAALVFSQNSKPDVTASAALSLIFSGPAAIFVFVVAFLLAVVVQSWLIFHLFRQNGRLLLRIEALESSRGSAPRLTTDSHTGLKIGSSAPVFELPLARGGNGSLDGLRQEGKPVVLVFSDANCGPCKALMPDLTRWQRQYSSKLTIAVITRGAAKDKIARQHDLNYVFIQKDREIAEQYHAFGTPTAILVGTDGLVSSTLASRALAIGELISAAASGNLPIAQSARLTPSQGFSTPLIGSPVPPLALPDLSGKPVRLDDFRGHQTMLLFWNPGCSYCNRMLPALKHWEETRARSVPRLVVISTGELEQNRAMGLRSPVLLDNTHSVSQSFGANGTPSALLVDGNGKIASQLVLGADAILALSGIGRPTSLETAKLDTLPAQLKTVTESGVETA